VSLSARLELLVAELRTREIDRLLVPAGANLRYLTGFTGSHGLASIDASPRGGHRFFTDFRYATQSARQLPARFEREIVVGELLEAVAGALGAGRGRGARRLGFDDTATSVKQHARLAELVEEGWELVPCGGVVESLREVKDEREIRAIRAACELAEEALRATLRGGLAGRTERAVAIELELAMRRLGAEAPSFPSIVAAAEHGALPHAEPRAVAIPPDALVTIDWGAYLDGYCSDCTRTYATGDPGEQAKDVYRLVLRAQEATLAALAPGMNGREVDAVAREMIEAAGHGEHFGHGVGHGVGLEIHEGPRLSRTAGEQPLRAGNVVTVEPGVYLPGALGVRIEDLVVLRDGGCERLTGLAKDLTVVR
jgi:Xaa-Pro aminopeptidase